MNTEKIQTMTRLAVLSLVLAGCGGTVPISIKGGPAEGDLELVEEAVAMLDLGVDWRGSAYGAVEIELVDDYGGGLAGRNFKRGPCRQEVTSERDVMIVAHEVGHALGLKHEAETPMHWDATEFEPDWTFTLDQKQDAWDEAALLSACHPAGD